nr:2556_t:CDS:2 [Entrophospora candida]
MFEKYQFTSHEASSFQARSVTSTKKRFGSIKPEQKKPNYMIIITARAARRSEYYVACGVTSTNSKKLYQAQEHDSNPAFQIRLAIKAKRVVIIDFALLTPHLVYQLGDKYLMKDMKQILS